jgi:DNA-directed RNA polymerase II subunit RPB2
MDYLHINKLPNGENLIVAIMPYLGYNQEDSIILNQDSVDRGMFNLTYYSTHIAKETESVQDQGGAECRFENPSKQNDNKDVKITRFANYTKIDDNGLPRLNEVIGDGDCIVGKVLKTTETIVIGDAKTDIYVEKKSRVAYKSTSDIADGKTVYGTVNQVATFDLGDDLMGVKVQLRQVRAPELGDKMASRHGQKGVIGAIMPRAMMPFTKDGLVPDMIINPHAFPSRMTIGHLIECTMAKAGAMGGFYADGTPFENQDVNAITSTLTAHGLDSQGDEIMYNGITGEQMACEIFIGPTYYFRLKHMVADKVNYRADGQMVGMTQQPPKGRGNNGGLRVGEMETNVLIAHGLSAFDKESMMERSDKYNMQAIEPVGKSIEANATARIEIPFSFKLMRQELMAMSVEPRILVDEDEKGEFEADNMSDFEKEDDDSDSKNDGDSDVGNY